MNNPYRVECYKNFSCKKIRRFTTVQKAVDFANDWHGDHYDQRGWDVQIITPAGVVHQTNPSGNTSVSDFNS